jgi:GDPmannose 4,6-dehydratase
MKRALICGISGQDGAYLAELLLKKGYAVFGTSRDASLANFENLSKLGIQADVKLISMIPADFRSVMNALIVSKPDEVYNLSGQSSVAFSFEQPSETIESIVSGTLNLLEGMRTLKISPHFYNAGSAECFGNVPKGQLANEKTPFQPKSPYAIAKSAAYWLVANYRDSYEIYACTGILFNHESPLRPARFVTRKIIKAAVQIASGAATKLTLGNLSIRRDWGWSPEYVEAMWLMLQQGTPEDFVIASGETNSLEDFVCSVFSEVGLDWRHHVLIDPDLFRPSEIQENYADCSKAHAILKWSAKKKMREVITEMVRYEKASQGR